MNPDAPILADILAALERRRVVATWEEDGIRHAMRDGGVVFLWMQYATPSAWVRHVVKDPIPQD